MSVRVLRNPKKTPWDAYNTYLTTRAKWLGLDPHDRSDRVCARVGAMLRLFTEDQGTVLKGSMQKIDPDTLTKIVTQLDIGSGSLPTLTNTYMPAVLVNLSNNTALGATK